MRNKIILICLIAFFATPAFASAATRTWVGGTDTLWNTNANWLEGSKPTSADDVIASSTPINTTINLSTTAATVNSIDFSTAGANIMTFSGSAALTVAGNITAQSGMTWSHYSSAGLTITGASTLTSNSVVIGDTIIVNGASAYLTLGDDFNNTTNSRNLLIARGTFDTSASSFQVDTSRFYDNANNYTHVLTLNSSTINCTNVSFSAASGATLTSADHIVNVSSNDNTINYFGAGDWGKVNFKSNASTVRTHVLIPGTGATFVEFNIDQLTDRRDVTVSFGGGAWSVASSSYWRAGGIDNDDPTYRMFIKSYTPGSAVTISFSVASQTITFLDVDLQDMVVSTNNSPTVVGTRVGDCGGNTNVDVETPKTVYLVGGTVSRGWSDTVWATSTGATYVDKINFPLPQDTAVIDNNSYSLARFTTFGVPRIGAVDTSSLTEDQIFIFSASTFYGDLDLSGGNGYSTYFSSVGSSATFDARVVGTLNVNISDPNVGNGLFTVNSLDTASIVKLETDINHSGGAFTLTKGILDLNGKTLTTSYFSSSNTNTRELRDSVGGGKIAAQARSGNGLDMTTTTNLTVQYSGSYFPIDIDMGTSTQTYIGHTYFKGGGQHFGDFTVKNHAGDFDTRVYGSNYFEVMTLETPDASLSYSDLATASSTTQTITSLVADGTASYKINISSDVAGNAATLSDSAGTNTVTYCTITDSTAEGGATFNAYTTSGNVNGGNNNGWIFDAPAVGGNDTIIFKAGIFKNGIFD